MARRDWIHLTRPRRSVIGRVTGHRAGYSKSTRTYAAIYAFDDESGPHEVIDQVFGSVARPAVGALVPLTYPEGRPDLARPPRPLIWWAAYAMLAYGLAVLVGKGLGLIGG